MGRLLNAAFILGALTLLASAWAPYTPGMITGGVILGATAIALTVRNRRRGPQVPLNAPDRDRDDQPREYRHHDRNHTHDGN